MFYVKHGMTVDKVHQINSFKQLSWLEKYKSFKTQKWNQNVNEFEKDFYKLLKNAFYRKTMGKVRNRIKVEFNRKDDEGKIYKNNI